VTAKEVPASPAVTLVVRRTVNASPERLFEAWTTPAELKSWWGPGAVTCVDPDIDLRVGGRYRIGNQFPDGKVLWIVGEYEVVDPPHKLVYTWRLESQPEEASERVTVSFEPRGVGATEVIVVHERIPDTSTRERHEQGWIGCLDGLVEYLHGT
jgi:uncharacterized protein YndB with AHSA1/START domain